MHETIEFLKLLLRPRYALAFAVTGLMVLAVPLPKLLVLDGFQQEYGKWLGIISVLGFVTWAIEVIIICGSVLKTRFTDHSRRKAILAHLDSLSGSELLVLGKAVENGRQTVEWNQQNLAIPSLIHKKLLESTDDAPGDSLRLRSYVIPRFVWEYIKNPKHGILARASEALPDRFRKHAVTVRQL